MFKKLQLPLGAYQTVRVEPVRDQHSFSTMDLVGPVMQVDIISSMRKPWQNDHARLAVGAEQNKMLSELFRLLAQGDTLEKNLTLSLTEAFGDVDYFSVVG